MFDTILPYWDIIIKIILNTVLVSIPEEIYLVMITLILVGEFDYWKEEECKKIINRWDYSRILIPSVTVALLLNVARYTNMDVNISSTVCLIIFYGLIVITNDVLKDARPLKWMSKAFIFLIVAQISVGLIELLYIPFILYGTGKTIDEINNNIFINFLVSLPTRLIQLMILAFFVSKKRTLLKGNLIKCLVSSPVISILISAVIIFDLLFLFIMHKVILNERILLSVPHAMQILVIVGAVLFPILNISGLVWAIYYNKNREMIDKRNTSNKLENLLDDIKSYTNDENYEDIRWKLNEIGNAIEEIAENLYSEKNSKNKGG